MGQPGVEDEIEAEEELDAFAEVDEQGGNFKLTSEQLRSKLRYQGILLHYLL